MVWVISMASIFGTILWCLLLGVVLLRWSVPRHVLESSSAPA